MLVYNHLRNNSGVGIYRAAAPAAHCFSDLSKHGIHVTTADNLTTDCDFYNAYRFARVPGEAMSFFCDTIVAKSALLLWDVDDMIVGGNIPSYLPNIEREEWMINKVLDLATSISVSTKPIYDALPEHVKAKARIVPNLIDLNAFPAPRPKAADAPIRILYHGGDNHAADLAMIEDVIEELVWEMGCRIQFLFFGYCPTRYLECMRTTGMAGQYRVKEEYGENLLYLHGLPFAQFYHGLSLIAPDISLLPLLDNKWNSGVSANKYLESTLAGAACICSDLTPYKDAVGIKVMPNQWKEAIIELIENEEKRRELAAAALDDVRRNWSWQERKQVWVDYFLEALLSK